jgi:non-ribosomal peptide synthetase component E (peptide arylation enzyme)
VGSKTDLLSGTDHQETTTASRAALIDAPNRAACAFGEPKQLTFNELDSAVWVLACELYDAGIRKGDTVILQMPNIAEHVLAYLAIMRLGADTKVTSFQVSRDALGKLCEEIQPKAYISVAHFGGEAFVGRHQMAFPTETLILAFGDKQPESAQLIGTLRPDIEALDACQRYAARIPSPDFDQLLANCPADFPLNLAVENFGLSA